MFTRRHFLKTWAALPVALQSQHVLARQLSDKPIRLLVAASSGTTVDTVARFLAPPLAGLVGAPVVVENRPGAGGALGSAAVAKAPADGHTLLMTGITHFSALYSGEAAATYDPVRDFKGVARACSAALALVVPANSPYRTFGDLLAAMKANPEGIDYGSGGVGSTSHLCTAIMNDLTGTRARHIPYKGNTQAVTDTAAGIVAFTCQGAAGVLPLIQAGRLRALLVTSPRRWDALPDVPTGVESGIPGFEVSSWMAAFAPAQTPDPIVVQLSDAIARIVRSFEFKDFCANQSMYVDLMEYREFQASIPAEDKRWQRVAELIKRS
ncbi:tripartite tricarboxylate transporter family receptor [Bordetella bronchiseptica B18-5 (C3)]|uniref:Bug family tripartite tricarboxylate transporter substrate binding protein n=1 Tax=Bordetella bronchiseptica TaxID=518 RepID=UPI000461F639|nr:tripartite tricarboxylate transporter substrate binding protein [Bordetella bronchiseptica]KDB58824.1 tripartite tricarboxylate transporter family receptor [Bordetella bronchiseptica B18-5 (C3)]KDD88511.1 tripartite tricarboxylate transporter family receptor [Bordetella bronchiseptica MBORD762]